MERAFSKLMAMFLNEFKKPVPPSVDDVKMWCITYCALYEVDEAGFRDVSSIQDIFYKIAELKYCNFLTLGLLEHLAELSNNKCLIISINNYNKTFCHTEVTDQASTLTSPLSTVKATRKRYHCRSYRQNTRMFTKLRKKSMTHGQMKKFRDAFSRRIICIHPRSVIPYHCGTGSVYLGWQIPLCLVDVVYHAACTNTALFAQLGIKYLIIDQYKIEPPTTCVRGMSYIL